ncbi:ECF transporter S component [Weissella diestrammenae]|uniref:Riboflavin transporter n=1 Tax=Weissella diestrammenae TaxID=1162633 RepID=A0A7G9T5Q5_9LACO|nr:ECF transporter S component [Weissella diestrammenae]MCM0582256.1 ECF transporter S component [Weissella diestrammenae]QNN75430.1 ECF transporter S component [Weissella diestrammenae]
MKTRQLTVIALLSAVAFVLMVFASFPIIPSVSFLKIDLSFVPIFIGATLLDLKSGYAILLVRSVLKLLLNNAGVNDYIGLPMNILAFALLLTIMVYYLKRTRWQLWLRISSAVVIGSILTTVLMVALNYYYAVPLYAQFANFDISKTFGVFNYLIMAVVPFNLLQGVILSGLAVIMAMPIQRALKV